MANLTNRLIWSATGFGGIDPSNQIAYLSVAGVAAGILFEISVFLAAHGVTCKGSCDGTTGAMDNTNRWTDATKTTTRGAAAGNAQSWWCGQNQNGDYWLLCYQGATDDGTFRISFSPTAFTAAGTPNQQPTSSVEQLLTNGTTVVGTETSGDRRWSGRADSTGKCHRFAIARQGITRCVFGVEITDKKTESNVTWNGTYGFFITNGGAGTAGALITNAVTSQKKARLTFGGVGVSATCFYGAEYYNDVVTTFNNIQPPAQGGAGYPGRPLFLGSSTASGEGKYAELYDQWMSRVSGSATNDADFVGANTHILLFGLNGLTWPWDGSTTVWA